MKKLLFYGGDGRVLKVRYKGQRGEGVYDLVWNGLVDNVERRYKETFLIRQRQSMSSLCALLRVRAVRDRGLSVVTCRYGCGQEHI